MYWGSGVHHFALLREACKRCPPLRSVACAVSGVHHSVVRDYERCPPLCPDSHSSTGGSQILVWLVTLTAVILALLEVSSNELQLQFGFWATIIN